MTARRGRLPLPLILPLLVLLGGCTVDPVEPAGRPCSSAQPCGPGTICHPTKKVCVLGDTDGGRKDITPTPDKLPSPDKRQPDQLLAPDGGCPKGFTRCGKICADTKKDSKHCGKCGAVCPAKLANKCVAGRCVCQTTSAPGGGPCKAGLTCVAGECRCTTGSCNGCCSNDVCYPLGSAQSMTRCGKGGEACRACKTSICNSTSCSVGLCKQTPLTGKSCNDGKPCTYLDKCSAGTCKGTGYGCNDYATCTTETCTGNAPPQHCKYVVASGYCAINNKGLTTCYKNGASHPSDQCLKCDTAKSTSMWSKVTGCGSGPAVTTVASGYAFYQPKGVAVNSAGALYISDTYANVIRKWDGNKLTTLAGSGTKGLKDGTGTAAQFYRPAGLVVAPSGKLYVADASNHAIRTVSSSGVVTTLAGTGTAGLINGAASQARFYEPSGLAVDSAGKVYVSDLRNHVIRLISGSTVSTFAGAGKGFADGSYATARFNYPFQMALTSSGAIYVTDVNNHKIRKLYAGKVSTFAGGTSSGNKDGPISSALFAVPYGLAVSASGKVYVADTGNYRVRLISGSTVSTLAGSTKGYKDGNGTAATFASAYGIAVHSSGKVYVADTTNNRVRMLTLTGSP